MPYLPGSWKTVADTWLPASLSSRQYSAAARHNVKLLFRNHVVDLVRIHAGCVHDIFCLEDTVVGYHTVSFCRFFNFFHFCVEYEFNAVITGILCQRDRQTKWTYDAAGRCIERATTSPRRSAPSCGPHRRSEWKYPAHRLPRLSHRVPARRAVLLREAEYQGGIPLEIKIEFFG